MKEYTITMTSKGQFTMPIDVREALGVSKTSNKLKLIFDAKTNKAAIERPMSFDEISKKAQSYVKPGVKPLLDPRSFYESRNPKS